ncbi:MAG: hypothetical protein HOF74_00570 [Gammaproteobacteria bacterium]|nr:hypothetical protein [Gammaproteobacteria bacterium]MBT3858298.1 hypothetical protein [Gammaproteobacteria bacterium]MBT3988579.1 hypothetical protein [Gammaproteobacteria bacterium]MBT4257356.1 hypothetical protein [Gammaproteobacteria bacterium]MBT4580483.1 hypothetical protein [Gammaproteobacteria bacterium]
MNQFVGMFALLPVEKILNTLATRDPYIANQFGKFEGKIVEIQCLRPTLSMNLRFEGDRLKLSAIDCETLGLKSDAGISGAASDLAQLLFQDSADRPLANDAISISGDAVLVQDIYRTVSELDVDWGDLLAPFLGDLVSNELRSLSKNTRQWSETAKQSVERNIDEYLTEEARIIPDKTAVESFGDDLDRLKLRIDRARAQADILGRRLESLNIEQ